MKINRIRYSEVGHGGQPVAFGIDTSDLSAEEYAELRSWVDLCGLLQTSGKQQASCKSGLSIILETQDSVQAYNYSYEPPEEVKNFADFLKGLKQAQASYAVSSACQRNEPGAAGYANKIYFQHATSH